MIYFALILWSLCAVFVFGVIFGVEWRLRNRSRALNWNYASQHASIDLGACLLFWPLMLIGVLKLGYPDRRPNVPRYFP